MDEPGTVAINPQRTEQPPQGAGTDVLSPQDFYHRLVNRPDIRDLLARLAKR